MSREIPRPVKDEAFKLWLGGYSYRKIRDKAGMSLGAINQMVAEARAKIPNLDELRQLNIVLSKSGASVYDAVRGSKLLEMLNQCGVGLDTLHAYIGLCGKISAERGIEAQSFVDAGMRLISLEAKTGKSYEQVLKDFEEKRKQVEGLEARAKNAQGQVQELVERRAQLEKEIREAEERLKLTLQRLNQAMSANERLQRLGLEKVSRLAKFIESFEVLKFDVEIVRKLAEWRTALADMRINPDMLGQFVKEKGPLEIQLRNLRAEAKRLKGEVEMLEKRRTKLSESNSSLFYLSKILESKRTSLPCKRCGWPIPIILDKKENYVNLINQGFGLSVSCPNCRQQNWFDPREVILSVGWAVLPA
jgi:prefoldin subunit 5